MNRASRNATLLLPAIALSTLLGAPSLQAECDFTEVYSAQSVVSTDDVCRLKTEFPYVQAVQLLLLGNVQDLRGDLPVSCQAQVMRGEKGVSNAKFRPH